MIVKGLGFTIRFVRASCRHQPHQSASRDVPWIESSALAGRVCSRGGHASFACVCVDRSVRQAVGRRCVIGLRRQRERNAFSNQSNRESFDVAGGAQRCGLTLKLARARARHHAETKVHGV